MSGDKTPATEEPRDPPGPLAQATDSQTDDLMSLVARLGQRDLAAVLAIVRRASEISETDGEDVAIAVLDQIHGILEGRNLDA